MRCDAIAYGTFLILKKSHHLYLFYLPFPTYPSQKQCFQHFFLFIDLISQFGLIPPPRSPLNIILLNYIIRATAACHYMHARLCLRGVHPIFLSFSQPFSIITIALRFFFMSFPFFLPSEYSCDIPSRLKLGFPDRDNSETHQSLHPPLLSTVLL